MRPILLLMVLVLSGTAQQPSNTPPTDTGSITLDNPSDTTSSKTSSVTLDYPGNTSSPTLRSYTLYDNVDSKLHADVLTLIDFDGARQRVQNILPELLERAKSQITRTCPNCPAAFGDEWARRMLQRLNVSDLVDVAVLTYEKYLNDDEVKQLIAFLRAKKESRPATLSPAVQQKLTSVMPSIVSEIMAGCVQITTKLGAQIGQQIGREHPEYFKALSKSISY